MTRAGYRKDPDDKYSLLIDDEAAEVVRRIFREYIEGKSAYQIAQDLNGEDVEAPAVYIKRTVGYDCQKGAPINIGYLQSFFNRL